MRSPKAEWRSVTIEPHGRLYEQSTWKRLSERLHYMQGNIKEEQTYRALCERLAELDTERGTGGNYLFYLAIPLRPSSRVLQPSMCRA